MWYDLLPLFLFLGLLVVTLLSGMIGRSLHYRSIHDREEEFLPRPAVTFHTLPGERRVESSEFAQGSVVISVDYFRRFLNSFKKIFGGELGFYSETFDRGRREALLRMKESVPDADLYLNTRLETASLSGKMDKPTGRVEIVAYATAIRFVR